MNLLKNKDFYILLLPFCVFLLRLGGYPLFDVDEGAFSEATRQMFERGDFVTPWLNGEPRFDKPVLIYWLQALGFLLFGASEWAFRLPSALAACLWAILPYYFLRQRGQIETARTAALMIATSLGVLIIGRSATADALLNVLLAASLLDIYRYFESGRKRALMRVFFWMGLGVLDKGPVAILIPLAVSGLFFLTEGQWKAWLKAVFNPWGIALLLLVAAPWYVLEYQREGMAFIDGFILRHNVQRFSSAMEQHGGSVLYYLAVLPLLLLPYSSWFFRTLVNIRNGWDDPLQRFLWLWFGFVLVFFSLSGTKLPHYVLYGITPLLMLMAWRRRQIRSWLHLLPGLLLLLLMPLLPFLMTGVHVHDAHVSALLSEPGHVFVSSYMRLAVFFLAAGLAIAVLPTLAVWQRLVGLGLVQALMLILLLLPTAGRLQQQPVVDAAQFAREHHLSVIMWRVNWPTFNVYSQQGTPRRDPVPGEVVLTMPQHLADLPAYETLFAERGVVLARVGAKGSAP